MPRSPHCERQSRGTRAIFAEPHHLTQTGEDRPMRQTAIAAAFLAVLVAPALAQTPPAGTPTRVRGTVEKLDGQNLVVKAKDGQSLTIALAANYTVSALVKKTAADIKQ